MKLNTKDSNVYSVHGVCLALRTAYSQSLICKWFLTNWTS